MEVNTKTTVFPIGNTSDEESRKIALAILNSFPAQYQILKDFINKDQIIVDKLMAYFRKNYSKVYLNMRDLAIDRFIDQANSAHDVAWVNQRKYSYVRLKNILFNPHIDQCTKEEALNHVIAIFKTLEVKQEFQVYDDYEEWLDPRIELILKEFLDKIYYQENERGDIVEVNICLEDKY